MGSRDLVAGVDLGASSFDFSSSSSLFSSSLAARRSLQPVEPRSAPRSSIEPCQFLCRVILMAKRGRKKAIKKSPPKPKTAGFTTTCTNGAVQFEQKRTLNGREVERRVTAIQAIRDAEIETLLSQLRLLRSYFSTEQLQIPALQFFKENLPNISVLKNEKYGVFELEWKKDDYVLTNHVSGQNMRTSVGTSATLPAMRDLQFSTRSVKTNFLDAASLQIPDFDFGESSGTQMLGLRDAFQTPGENSHRLSVGMTPKTRRLPKHGEMLLSIRGSPLGVYREENLEAIHESEDSSHCGASK